MAARSAADPVRADAMRDPSREDKMRPTAALRGDMSRAEAAVRRVTHEWVLACNTKHLDDLLDLYVPMRWCCDRTVLRFAARLRCGSSSLVRSTQDSAK